MATGAINGENPRCEHDNCLEVLVVRGDGARIRALCDALVATKGVKHGRLTVTATG